MLHDDNDFEIRYFLTAFLKEPIFEIPLMSFGSKFQCFGAVNEKLILNFSIRAYGTIRFDEFVLFEIAINCFKYFGDKLF